MQSSGNGNRIKREYAKCAAKVMKAEKSGRRF
jgi:hypothetical protein